MVPLVGMTYNRTSLPVHNHRVSFPGPRRSISPRCGPGPGRDRSTACRADAPAATVTGTFQNRQSLPELLKSSRTDPGRPGVGLYHLGMLYESYIHPLTHSLDLCRPGSCASGAVFAASTCRDCADRHHPAHRHRKKNGIMMVDLPYRRAEQGLSRSMRYAGLHAALSAHLMTTMAASWGRCRWGWPRPVGAAPAARLHMVGGSSSAQADLFTTPVCTVLDRLSCGSSGAPVASGADAPFRGGPDGAGGGRPREDLLVEATSA